MTPIRMSSDRENTRTAAALTPLMVKVLAVVSKSGATEMAIRSLGDPDPGVRKAAPGPLLNAKLSVR